MSNPERIQVEPRLRQAIDASVGWYEDLCALHAVPTTIERGVWRSIGRPPPLHSDLVVVEPEVGVSQVTGLVLDPGPCGCKDSFATVDLSPAGFTTLFSATWMHLAATATPRSATLNDWVPVVDAVQLSEWTTLHGTSEVLLPGLLRQGHFRILAKYADQRIVAGAVARLASGVVDVSNVFFTPDCVVDWASLVATIQTHFPGRPLVGYEREAALEAACDAGFVPVGDLRVWVR